MASHEPSDDHPPVGSDDDIRDDESLSSLTSLEDDADSAVKSSNRRRREPQQPVEWLATSRSKRSTAGNRMRAMLAQETEQQDPEDELELLFAEDENDEGFVFEGNDDDLNLDSDSDDEDDQPGDELEGERELEKAEKAARMAARKRKSQAALPAKFRKKVRIQHPNQDFPEPPPRPTLTGNSATPRDVLNQANAAARLSGRPRKKSDRSSWLPSNADQPVRASERKTTKHSKELLHQRMREGEERRKRQVATMERQAKHRAALEKPPMTQEDRIAEAALVEKRNSKSLNRWEEAEKQREEERKAKLAALNNRTLHGPVITYWSGVREWNDNMNGAHMALEEKPKRRRPTKAEKEKELLEKLEKERLESGVSVPEANTTSVGGDTAMPDAAPTVEATEPKLSDATTSAVANGASLSETSKPSNPPQSTEPAPPPDALNVEPPKQTEQPPIEVTKKPVEEATETSAEEPLAQKPVDKDGDVSMDDTATELANESPKEAAIEKLPTSPIATASVSVPMPTDSPSPVTPVPSVPKVTAGLQLPPGFAPPSDDNSPMPPPPMKLGCGSPAPAKPTNSSQGALAAPVLAPPLGAPNLLEESLHLSMGMSAPKMAASGGFLAAPSGLTMPLGYQKSAPDGPVFTIPSFGKPEDKAAIAPPPPPSLVSPTEQVRTLSMASNVPSMIGNSTSVVGGSIVESAHMSSLASNAPTVDSNVALAPPPVAAPQGPAMRTAYILQSFDENAIKDKSVQTQLLFGQKMNRIAKPQALALCVITNQPAKYRDPVTGLPYYNVYAYKQLQKLRKGEHKWSQILGAYVGDCDDDAAAGVPDRFLSDKAAEKRKAERKIAEEQKKKLEAEAKAKADLVVRNAPVTAPIAGATLNGLGQTTAGTPRPADIRVAATSGITPQNKVAQPVQATGGPSVMRAPQTLPPVASGSATVSTPSSSVLGAPSVVAKVVPGSRTVSTIPASTPGGQPPKPTIGGSTVLQPPMVPLTQLKPPAPAGLPPRATTTQQTPTQRVLAPPAQQSVKQPVGHDNRITGMAPWGVPRPVSNNSIAPQRTAPRRPPTQPRALPANARMSQQGGSNGAGTMGLNGSVNRSLGQTTGMAQQRGPARTFHVSAPGQTLPPRNAQGQIQARGAGQAQSRMATPKQMVSQPLARPVTQVVGQTQLRAPAQSRPVQSLAATKAAGLAAPIQAPPRTTSRQPPLAVPSARPAPLAVPATVAPGVTPVVTQPALVKTAPKGVVGSEQSNNSGPVTTGQTNGKVIGTAAPSPTPTSSGNGIAKATGNGTSTSPTALVATAPKAENVSQSSG